LAQRTFEKLNRPNSSKSKKKKRLVALETQNTDPWIGEKYRSPADTHEGGKQGENRAGEREKLTSHRASKVNKHNSPSGRKGGLRNTQPQKPPPVEVGKGGTEERVGRRLKCFKKTKKEVGAANPQRQYREITKFNWLGKGEESDISKGRGPVSTRHRGRTS